MRNGAKPKRYFVCATLTVLLPMAYLLTLGATIAPAKVQKDLTEGTISERIALLMGETLRQRDRSTPEGRKVWVRVPPNRKAVEQIKGHPDKAVPVLAEYSHSGTYHERELAIELLSQFAPGLTAQPFIAVIRSDPEPGLRADALGYIAEAPSEVAYPILQEASTSDADSRIREKARYLLERCEARDVQSPSRGFIRKRIGILVAHTISEGQGITSEGVRISFRASPSKEDVDEVKRYSEDAVPILAEYLTPHGAGAEKRVAMQLLSLLGGSRIVAPLKAVAETDPTPDIRSMALLSLTEAPWDLAAPIIRAVANTDRDPDVRNTAQKLLQEHQPQ